MNIYSEEKYMGGINSNEALVKSSEEILQLAVGFQKSRVMLSAFELGLFTALGRNSLTSGDVAALLRTDTRATERLLNALCALGLVHKLNDFFSNTPAGLRFLVKGEKDYLAGLEHISGLWNNWNNLTEAVKNSGKLSSEPLQRKSAEPLASFIAAMHHWGAKRAPEVVSRLDLEDVSQVLDLGGGSGVYAMAFVRGGRGITATVFDLPDVIPLTQQYINQTDLSGRIDTVGGDYNIDELGNGYDLVFLSSVICVNSSKQNLALMGRVAKALKTGGRVVIHDFVMDEDRSGPAFTALFALSMLLGTQSGDAYTESEIENWLKSAAFKNIHRVDSVGDLAMLIGRKSLA